MARILADWEPLLETTLAAWGEGDGGGLSAAFEAHRAAQLAADADSFVALNPLYPGVADALQVWGGGRLGSAWCSLACTPCMRSTHAWSSLPPVPHPHSHLRPA